MRFLSRLASETLIEAASHVRSDRRRPFEPAELFANSPDAPTDTMTFRAEMVIPATGIDDLGQTARASHTLLRYELTIRLETRAHGTPTLKVDREVLVRLPKKDVNRLFPFAPAKEWIDSIFHGTRRSPDFISTTRDDHNGETLILLHQDGGGRGQPLKSLADKLPRTVLSGSIASESPTVFLAKREMQSWIQLQLEPSALRRPDEFTDPPYIDADGKHLPITLNRLQQRPQADPLQIMGHIAIRLSELIEEIKSLRVVRDDARKFYSIVTTDWQNRDYPAQALSDGTLRFLALAVIEADPETTGTICLEEPENGIHPARIPAMVRLLRDIACDVTESVNEDNPLRQVIVNTHSPKLVRRVPNDSLLFVTSEHGAVTCFAPSSSWRVHYETVNVATPSQILDYLDPQISMEDEVTYETSENAQYLLALDEPNPKKA
ncbi:MAG: AAA family ATPase [Spirochaetales bacterium]|nr:AAA family ATPase [Spirochaetales bacterium]